MGCGPSKIPKRPKSPMRRPSPALSDSDMSPSLRIRVVSHGASAAISPKSSSIAELFPEDDNGNKNNDNNTSNNNDNTRNNNKSNTNNQKKNTNDFKNNNSTPNKYIYRPPNSHSTNYRNSNFGGNSSVGAAFKMGLMASPLSTTHGGNSSRRPSSIDLGAMDSFDPIEEDQEIMEEEFVSIDDLADAIIEISTDDGSSSDSSIDSEYEEQFKYMQEEGQKNNDDQQLGQSGVSVDTSLRRKTSTGSSTSLSSSSNSLRRKNSGSSPTSPLRKNSAHWRESSVLSPAVARLSADVFPRAESRPRMSLNRFRNVSRKIHMGVRIGHAIKKVQDLNGMKRINQYLILRALGEGSYGKVKLAEDVNTGKQFAMKVLRKTTAKRAARQLSIHSSADTVAGEIAIMKKLNHPNVVKLYEVLETPTTVYLFLEFRPQGPVIDLEKEMQKQAEESETGVVNSPSCPKLELETVRRYVRDIIQGLSYLHAHGVIHQDLKPNNLLLAKDGTVAISDFGISTLISSKSDLVRITNNGTPAFMSPELHGAQSAAHSGQAADLWSLGVIIYCFVVGCLPFWAPNVIELAQKIQLEPYTPVPKELNLSDNLITLLSHLLNKDPIQRCTLQDLAHNNWITKDGREPLKLTTKDEGEDLNATGFEISNALSFARIVRLKTKMRRLVDSARKKTRPQGEGEDPNLLVSPTTALRRRSNTKSIIANASGSDSGMSINQSSNSLTSYRSNRRRTVNGIGSRPSRLMSNVSFEAVSETGTSDDSSSDDDNSDGEDEIVVLENSQDLDSHLKKPQRARRRYSEVIPGRVDLSGIVSMRRDCVNLSLRLVCSTQADINGKPEMEDRHISIVNVNAAMNLPPGIQPIAFFGVYDGHSGSDCAEFVRLNLHQYVFQDPQALIQAPEKTLIQAYDDCDKQWLNNQNNDGQINYSGSTAATILFVGNKLIIASVGDTRAVLARQGTAVDLTEDHIPTLQSETERIHRAGGAIVRGRVQGVLGVARSFGDIEFKTLKEKSWGGSFSEDLVTSIPDVKIVDILPEDEFIIIASDGLFDIFSSQRTIGRFKAHLTDTAGDVPKSLKLLIKDAMEMRPGHDNITATCIIFTDHLFPGKKK